MIRLIFILLALSCTYSYASLSLFSWDGEAIERVREKQKHKPIRPRSLSASILQIWRESKNDIENLRKNGYPSVHDKNETVDGANGDKSYYSSIVPYAFPCNKLPDGCIDYEGNEFSGNCSAQGLPWAICDGKVSYS